VAAGVSPGSEPGAAGFRLQLLSNRVYSIKETGECGRKERDDESASHLRPVSGRRRELRRLTDHLAPALRKSAPEANSEPITALPESAPLRRPVMRN
jgi:hypothetical protein